MSGSNIFSFPDSQNLHVSTAWAQSLLAEHTELAPSVGQQWSLRLVDDEGNVSFVTALLEMISEGEPGQVACQTFHFVNQLADQQSNKRFSLSMEKFLQAKPCLSVQYR